MIVRKLLGGPPYAPIFSWKVIMHNWKPAVGYIRVSMAKKSEPALKRTADLLRDYTMNNGL